ncbi:MAG: trypsin-like peptidase domain-containing protein, partial [Clostridia bacterium]|nr:trypsin-like peptidase domain-containing protein [Clostridia bacterium]
VDRKGLKVFCIILALAIAVSCCSTVAYFLGKNHTVQNNINNKPVDAVLSTATEVYNKTAPAVVGIYVYNNEKQVFNASGIVYSEDGYIITTDSIFANITAPEFVVATADGKEYSAYFVGGDQRSDIAVLKIDDTVKLPFASFGNSDQVAFGEKVYLIGRANGYDEAAVISDGIVAAPMIRVTNTITTYSSKMIESTNAANPGAFGGALVNEYSQIIGMVSTKVVSSGYEQITYTVPSNEVKNITEQIINNGHVADRARIGISYVEKNAADAKAEGLKSRGLMVADVSSETELSKTLKQGDIITEINGKKEMSDDDVLDLLETMKPGETITLKTIGSDGKETKHTAKLLTYKSVSSYKSLPLVDDLLPDDSYEGY